LAPTGFSDESLGLEHQRIGFVLNKRHLRETSLRDLLDQLDDFFGSIAEFPCHRHELSRFFDESAMLGRGPADGDSSSPAKLQQTLLPEGVKSTQNCVPVHP
jgi:hypothetical protein